MKSLLQCFCEITQKTDNFTLIECTNCQLLSHKVCYFVMSPSSNEFFCLKCRINITNVFQKFIKEILKPITIKTNNNSINPNLNKFSISNLDYNDIYSKNLALMVYFVKAKRQMKDPLYFGISKDEFLVKINEKPIELEKNCPFYINNLNIDLIKIGENLIEIELKNISVKEIPSAILGINLIEELEANYVLKKLNENNCYVDHDKKKDEEMFVTETYSTICPLSKIRIEIPAKGVNCNHFKHFCLINYIKLNKNNNHWKCPICKKFLYFKDLRIDLKIYEYFEKMKKNPLYKNIDTIIYDEKEKVYIGDIKNNKDLE